MIGRILQNRYRLDAALGQGAMGVVYRARDTALDRDVAVKLLSGAEDAEARARLLREARATAALNHPHIVAVHDTGEHDGVPFIVMELVEGGRLAGRAVSIERLCDIGVQLCAALGHAHEHGIVHRDLKPENVLVGANGTIKLADLGIARVLRGTRFTETGAVLGTAAYLAPEQALGGVMDGRADLYALGVVLYELAAGRLPFAGDDPLIVISQHLHAPVVPPSTYRDGLPPALEAVILRLLAKLPDDRFSSAGETAAAIEEARRAPAAAAGRAEVPGGARTLELLARGRMVGRRDELQQLRELWSVAMRGQAHLVTISGEPGVGKTRLAHEMTVHARLSGAAILRGGCYEYEATTPYLPFVEALRHWVHGQGADALRERLGALAPELARLAPEIGTKLGPLEPSPPLSPAEERLRLFDHVTRLFQSLARERGVLLVLDDLHWADQGTLTLLQYLMRNLREERLLVLAAYREAELDRSHPLAAALVDWNRQRLATRIALQRLPLTGTAELLATLFGQDSVSPDFAAALQRETEGNPFFVEEVVKTLIEQGQIYRAGADWQRRDVAELVIPQSIRAAVSRRLDRLGESCTRTLHIAAALGKTFAFAELAAVSDATEDELLDGLDEAAAAQVVRAEEEGTYAFTHDKIREVLLDELNPIRRRRLHQRIGEGLEKLLGDDAGIRAQDLAHHFVLSGDLARGLDYSLRAADAAGRVFAHDEALHFYARARECAEALKRGDEVAAIEERTGGVYEQQGDNPRAVEHYQRALALTGDHDRRAALKTAIGNVYANTGDARGPEYFEQALAELHPERQANLRALTLAGIGRYHHYRTQHAQALESLEQARQIAEPLDDPRILERVYAYTAGAYQHMARFRESMAWAERCVALGERTGFQEAVRIGYEFLGEDSAWMSRWDDAIQYAAKNREISERIGSLFGRAWSVLPRSWALFARGELVQVERELREGIALAERIGEDRLGTFYGSHLGQVLTELGEDDAARETAERALIAADRLGQGLIRSECRLALAHLDYRRGRWADALRRIEECYEFMKDTDNGLYPLRLGRYRAGALLELGRLDEAAAELADVQERAARSDASYTATLLAGIEARLHELRGDHETAARLLDRMIAALEADRCRLEWGHGLLARGAFRERRGDAAGAAADLAAGEALLAACRRAP